ncbi:peptidoglycan DD-metalloendopeptidase family protein [Legionella shakespearei]|uniref:Peptidase, M23/M37 family n=1 Tax=Legionella shakespearei DSM 23087 TaxID=1122169 RepID=A0A0W0YV47_9GAMM|nr:peptidoglycan DD-metalloendopeptidase family protein [Legionella shakespearei]KTD60784.1 peptidase, M23/M37 family [Legionella shakespearei DSM 23087]
MNKIIRTITLLSLFCLSHVTLGFALPENHAVNGGLTIIPVDVDKQPEAYYHGNRIPVLPGSKTNQWLLIVAIPLNVTDPIQYIEVTKPYKASIPFHVSEKFYNTQSLTIKDLSKVDPQPEDMIRIDNETMKLKKIFAHYSNVNPFEKSFTAPLRGPVSSLFGLKRLYNKQPRDPHSGLDIAGPVGEPIHAIANGIVAETGDYFFTGNTVIIDHGMGVFSLYAHLSKIMVQPGESIKQGQELGLVGMTGRVTGPHLHWTMIMNQTLVEPLLFVPVRNIATVPKPAAKTPQPTAVKS